MDYGSFLSSSVTMPWSVGGEDTSGITLKGITVDLGESASICFDTDLLRYAGGWTGGWLKLMGTPFDGTHRPPEGSRPAVVGNLSFMTASGPGWSRDTYFSDPRTRPYGPLPDDWGRYGGMYVYGEQVVFSYTIGQRQILDAPQFIPTKYGGVFTRTLKMGPGEECRLLILEHDERGRLDLYSREDQASSDPILFDLNIEAGNPKVKANNLAVFGEHLIGLTAAPSGAEWLLKEGRSFVLVLPASDQTTSFRVAVSQSEIQGLSSFRKNLKKPVENVSSWTENAPTRFPETIKTKGVLGNADNQEAYVVDTLTLPTENSWGSWIRIGGFDFFSEGSSAAISTWNGDVWTVSGIDDDLENLNWRRFATGLFQPLGLKIVKDRIYVLGRDQITLLHDLNQDGEADYYENFNNDMEVTPNFHEFACDLHTDPAGNFYFTKGAPLLGTEYFDPISAHNGCVLKVTPDGKQLEVFATGLRAVNGCGVGPQGQITCSDNEGIWTPVCRLNWVQKGGFYGCLGTAHRNPLPDTFDPPLCWLPFSVDNSSGGQVWVEGDHWGIPDGELLHLSYGKSSVFRVLKDEVDGVVQGGVVKFPLRFQSSVMRGRFNPKDGQLYVAGLKGWQTTAARDGALHRVRYTGRTWKSVSSLKVYSNGIELGFSAPLDKAIAEDPDNYALQQWNYLWSKEYGSDLFSARQPGKKVSKKGSLTGEEALISKAVLSSDGKSVFLEISDLVPVHSMEIQLELETQNGETLSADIYHTINVVPERKYR
ncbi:MAG TPA: hypothetical protein EYQ50_18725 [Verrucomicrobiales bacterium]|nr:hypothetical protein [Verrucomicrobiales bacterium]